MKHTLRHVKNKNNQEKKLCLVFYKGSLVNYVGMLVGGIYLVNKILTCWVVGSAKIMVLSC